MRHLSLLLLAALAIAAPGCTVHVLEPGNVTSDGSVYLGWNLFDAKGKADREEFPVGQQLGGFSSLRLHTDETVAFSRVVVIFADGERFQAPVPKSLGRGQWAAPIALPRGPRAIHSIVIAAKNREKGLAKVEIYGSH